MKCYRCGAENPDHATHCGSCGAYVEQEQPPSPLGVACGVALLIVFVPVGLCGLLVVASAPDPGYGFEQVAYVAIAIAAMFIYIAYLSMRRK